MTVSQRLRELHDLYRQIELATRQAPINIPPPDLPLVFNVESELCLLPASSIAVQALLPESIALHDTLITLQDKIRNYVPLLSGHVFWQAQGTFHLNVAILRRLSRKSLSFRERQELLLSASGWLAAIEDAPAYRIRFKGISVTRDGTIIVCGYPEDETPWRLRESLMAFGFPDQQKIFHITIGRIVTPLPPPVWHSLVGLAYESFADADFGDWVVRNALLVVEREGYLHNRDAYEVVASINFI